jgi:arylsulfatase A-like enzyme
MTDGRLALRALPLVLAGAAACGARTGAVVAPGVLLVVVDELRADHTGVYGYDRDTTPVLRELAAVGLRFEQVFAGAPLLIPAHTTILTGCEPGVARRFLADEFAGLAERRWGIPERAPRLAVEFLAAGYATAAFVDHELLAEAYGFAVGFQRYEILDPSTAEGWEGPQLTRAVDHFLKWLGGVPLDRPWFAYLHLHHLPRSWSDPIVRADGFFQPRPELDSIPPVANTDSVFFAVPRSRWRGGVRSLGQYEASYDEEVRRVDAEIGRLCATLRRQGRYETTSLHVLGAFGMQLGEAGLYLASGRYSMADLAVPWIVRPRAGLAAAPGRSIAGLVSTLDVAPTLLALEGLDAPRGMSGCSQAAAVRAAGAGAAARPYVFASCGLQEGCAVIGERHALEYLLPRGIDDAQLRRSWSGEWAEHALQPRVYFYDRLKTPCPPLDGEGSLAREPELAAYRSAAVEWLRAAHEKRLSLQFPAGSRGAALEVPASADGGLAER